MFPAPVRALPPLLALLSMALASACANAPATGAGPGICHADEVQWAVGQPGDQATMGRVWRESGAGLLRAIGPDRPVTRDHRRDRVNVFLDAGNRITAVTCG